jgi:hypothetical protein
MGVKSARHHRKARILESSYHDSSRRSWRGKLRSTERMKQRTFDITVLILLFFLGMFIQKMRTTYKEALLEMEHYK